MERLRELRARVDIYDLLSLGLILFLVGLALSYWSKFPVHMDSYYHMGVTSGFTRAGGIALHSFWEYAPTGRAQLYPPLLHVVMYGLTKTGLSTLSVARLVTFASYPLLLLSGWYGMRTLFSKKAALYSTVVLSSCYLLFWHSAVESAAALVLILTPLIFVAVERNRKIAAAVLLALALYSHLTLGHLVALGLLIYAVHRRQMFKEILWVLIGAYVLWLPWGIHILMNLRSLSFSSPGGGGASSITVHVLVWLAALAGFVYCYFKKGKYYLLPAFLLGFIPIVFFYPDRFWNAHVFLPLAMLGGVALAGLQDFVAAKVPSALQSGAARKAVLATVMAIPVALLLFFDPVYATGGGMGGGGGQPPSMGVGQTRTGTRISTSSGTATSANSSAAAAQVDQSQPPRMPDGSMPPVPPGMDPPAGLLAPGGRPPGGSGGPGGAGGPMGVRPGGAPPGGSGPGGNGLSTRSTTMISLLKTRTGQGGQMSLGAALIDSDDLELAQIIMANSTADSIVYAGDGPLGNMITGLTGRASTSGMFHEVSPSNRGAVASYQNASIIVVSSQGGRFAGGPGIRGGQQTTNIDTSKYKLVGTAGAYKVYKNAAATATSSDHGTVIPWYVVFPLLGLALAAAGIDWFRRRPDDPLGSTDSPQTDPTAPEDRDSARFSMKGGNGTNLGWKSIANEPRSSIGPGEVLAIVPSYDEAGNVGGVVDELKRYAPFIDVLVIDDGSNDDTALVAKSAGALVVSHMENRGIGASVRTGMSYALEAGYRYAVQVDGDGQHDPSYIEPLIASLEAGPADVVVGSRFLGTGDYKPPLARKVGIRVLAWAVSLVSGRKATDTTSGFRAMNRRAMRFLVANYPDDYPESESLILMDRAGIRWVESPVAMRARKSGVSSIRGLGSATYMAKVLGSIALDSVGLKAPRSP